jgi:peroxiredoxin
MLRFAKSFGIDAILWVVVIALVGTNVYLLQENRGLRAAAFGEEAPKVVEGKRLPKGLAASTLDRILRPISFSSAEGKRTLLITFSPTCPHCRANHKNWTAITDALRKTGAWNVLWVSRDAVDMTKDYADEADIPVAETYADPTFQTYRLLDLRVVPNTVVINNKGVVEKVWPGELDAAAWQDVFRYLQVPSSGEKSPGV